MVMESPSTSSQGWTSFRRTLCMVISVILFMNAREINAFVPTSSRQWHTVYNNQQHHRHGHDAAILRSTRMMMMENANADPNQNGDYWNDDINDKTDKAKQNHILLSRRRALIHSAILTATTLTYHPSPTLASTSTHISAEWSAIDGLNTLQPPSSSSKSNNFVSFESSAYIAMRDDKTRTPLFRQAIIDRLNNDPNSKPPSDQIVIDLGTGPFALFAIIAAQEGAGRVYAIEAVPEAARSARQYIQKAGFDDIITVLEGFSTDISLPQNTKADFVIAEIVGSVASEEGAYGTILDAHRRLVQSPTLSSSWIPSAIQTCAAPASYTLHNLFGPPEFDWGKLDGEPVRFSCRDEGLQLLSLPVLVEEFEFASLPSWEKKRRSLKFVVEEERIEENTKQFYKEYKQGGLSNAEAERLSNIAGRSLSGVALWPRLILNFDETKIPLLEISSRTFPEGGHQRSHWQTVLPIMSSRPVEGLVGGDVVEVVADFDVSDQVLVPCKYRLEGTVFALAGGVDGGDNGSSS